MLKAPCMVCAVSLRRLTNQLKQQKPGGQHSFARIGEHAAAHEANYIVHL